MKKLVFLLLILHQSLAAQEKIANKVFFFYLY